MGATMATVNSITKNIYTGKIVSQMQNEMVAMKRIERTSDGVTSTAGGNFVTFPLRIKRNNGIGYRNEMEQLQAAGNQGFTSVQVGLKYGYGRLRLSGQVMKLADKDYQAFASVLSDEMSGLTTDLGKDQNRIIYGDTLGTIATVTAKGVNTVTVADITFVQDGEKIDIVTAAGVSHAAARTVTAIDETTGIITYDGADASATIAVGDILVRTGNYGREPNGIGSIVKNTGVLYNVDPAVVSTWKALINANGGVSRALSEGLMSKMCDDIRKKGGNVSVILTSLGVNRSYANLLTQQRRYTNTKEFAGGYAGLAFNNGNEIPVIADPDAPIGKMRFLQEDSFKIYQMNDWDWLQMDGHIWKWLQDFDAWEAITSKYWELGCSRRNGNGSLDDVTES